MKKLMTLLMAVFGSGLHAATLDDVVARLERAEAEIHSLQFNFSQKIQLSLGGKPTETQGEASFQRPNRFRVQQGTVDPQIYVSDGKQFWIYFPERGQVLKDSMDNWARASGFPQGLTPFRMNVSEMKKKFSFSLASEEGSPVLVLKRLEAEKYPYTLRLWVDMEKGVAVKTELSSEAVTTVVTVSNVKVNPSIDKSEFRFVPPKGTDILEMPFK